MQATVSIPESPEILAAIIADLRGPFPGGISCLNKRGTKPYWLNKKLKWAQQDSFDALVKIGPLKIGLDTFEIEPATRERPDCPGEPGSWTGKNAYLLIELADEVGFWQELASWPWLTDEKHAEIYRQLMESEE